MDKLDSGSITQMIFKAHEDVSRRSITGSYIYLVIWFAIIIPSRFYSKNPEFCLWMTLALILFGGLRILLIFNFKKIYQKSPRLWMGLFYPIVLLVALLWGCFCASTFILPELDSMSLAFIISLAGLTGGGVSALAPNLFLSLGMITVYLTPGCIILFFSRPTISLWPLYSLFTGSVCLM